MLQLRDKMGMFSMSSGKNMYLTTL